MHMAKSLVSVIPNTVSILHTAGKAAAVWRKAVTRGRRNTSRTCLRTVCRTVTPQRGIIPIHGEAPEAFRDLVPEAKVLCLEDGETLPL